MGSSIILVLIGGLVSLASVVVGAILKHSLDIRKASVDMRSYPSQVLYNKQTEFFDKIIPVLDELNGYITRIDVWLGETEEDAREKMRTAAENNLSVTQFHEFLERYYLYLPKKLLDEANELCWGCFALRESPTMERTYECINLLFKFQNTIRKFVGVDELSDDLLKAFGSKTEQKGQDVQRGLMGI